MSHSDSVDSALTNKRLGIVVPRSTLLPPYLFANEYFISYADALDSVLGPLVDQKTAIISGIRNMWVQNPGTEATNNAHEIIDNSQWSVPEREIVVKQVNMLGMKLQNAGIVSDDAYQTISRFVGMYWFGKGTQSFIEFINYCLSSNLEVSTLWTEDYVDFLKEGDANIGTPIWEGGTWYPTTQVVIEASGGLLGLDLATLQSFFYEIANYNLVLQAIDQSYDMHMVDTLDGRTTANVVAIGGFGENNLVIANFPTSGSASPPSQSLPDFSLPTTYYAMGGVPGLAPLTFLLAEPNAWLTLEGGQLVPVYNESAQLITNTASLGSGLMGGDAVGGQYNLLWGPVTWIPLPGMPSSASRLPTYSTASYSLVDAGVLPTQVVGVRRNIFLVNPTGFFEVNPGQYVPYW